MESHLRDEHDSLRRHSLALDFEHLIDLYMAEDRWDIVRQAEARWLIAYGSNKAMSEIVEQYSPKEMAW